jgi:6,7-dimethyl-8-ribityllumazine synthase
VPIRIHVVAGFIHREICEAMVTHARAVTEELDATIEQVTWVPGSLEAPLAVKGIIENKRPDAIVVFGIQERGKTKHGEVIAHQATSKLLDLQLAYNVPMAVAIIGPDATLQHASRKAKYSSQKAMRAAAHMVSVLRDLVKQKKHAAKRRRSRNIATASADRE